MQIIKVPYVNSIENPSGCEKAPEEILNHLKKIGTKESRDIIEFNKLNIDKINLENNNDEESIFYIKECAKEGFLKNNKCIFLGGDHSISYPILKSFYNIQKYPLLIIFDSCMNCIYPDKYPKNNQWLRKLIDEGFSYDSILLISTRNISEEEMLFLKKNKITIINMDVLQEDIEGVCDIVMERARESHGFYISLDISCVDPSNAPGCNFIEPGGLSSREIIYFIKRLALLGNFIGGDIVEVNPEKDFNSMTSKLAAKILSEMI